VCGPPQLLHPDTITNPVVICEVLSPSTAAWDRGEKFRRYRSIGTLREYVLVSQDTYLIERYEREPEDRWVLCAASGLDALLTLSSVPCTIALRDIYDSIEFTEPPHVGTMTPEQYLDLERRSEIKHEYYNGRMWARSEGPPSADM
jgi:Uma2 family endonuclease